MFFYCANQIFSIPSHLLVNLSSESEILSHCGDKLIPSVNDSNGHKILKTWIVFAYKCRVVELIIILILWFCFKLCTGGRSGICWPNFLSGHNTAPKKPHHKNMAYNSIKGLMTVRGEFRLWALGAPLKTICWLFGKHIYYFSCLLSRHDIRQFQDSLLRRNKRCVHDQPAKRGPAAPCARVRHHHDRQPRGRQTLHPQAWRQVNLFPSTDTRHNLWLPLIRQ